MPHHSPELVDVVLQLAQHQAAMVRELAALRAQLRAPAAGRDETALLTAIGLAMGDRSFTAAELMVFGLGGAPAAHLLAAHVSGLSVRALGKRLAAIVGKSTVDGLVLERQGDSADGAIWRVSNPQTQPVAPRTAGSAGRCGA